MQKDLRESADRPEQDLLERKTVSRREFLKLAGVAGAAATLGLGVGGLAASCGGQANSTTSGAAVSETGSSTSVSADAETGEEIKLGFVSPQTGGEASFGVPDKYCVDRWNEAVKDGLVCGDGKRHGITVALNDTQSDANRASQVTGDLINNAGVDIILAASGGDTVPPAADQCEANGVPCLTTDTPWGAYLAARGAKNDTVFKWTYHFFWGLEDIIATYSDIWSRASTNKVVAAMWPNDSMGIPYRNNFGPVLTKSGFKVVDPGAYQDGSEDYTAQLGQFKKEACEILTGVMMPADFANFWKQAYQQGYKPKTATVAKCLLFPESLEALGSTGENLTTEVWWTPRHPFKSSLTGETCQQLGDDFEKRTGKQWTQPIMHYVVFEMAVDALKRAKDPKDKNSIIEAVKTMKFESIGGTIDFSSPVQDGTRHPVPNVYKSPVGGGQWVKGAKWPFDLVVVDNKVAPEITVEAEMKPLA